METVEDVIARCDNLYARWKADQEARRQAALEIIDILSRCNKEKLDTDPENTTIRKRKRRRRRRRKNKGKVYLHSQVVSSAAGDAGLRIDSFDDLENNLDDICRLAAKGTSNPQEFAIRVREFAEEATWQVLIGEWRELENGIALMWNIMGAVRAIKIESLKKSPCKAEVAKDVMKRSGRVLRLLYRDALNGIRKYVGALKHHSAEEVDEQQSLLKIEVVAAVARLYAELVAIITTNGSQYCTFYDRQN